MRGGQRPAHAARRAPAIAAAAVLFLPSAHAAPAPASVSATAFGLWLTETHHGIVQLAPCGTGGPLCGTLITSDRLARDPSLADAKNPDPALRQRLLKELVLLQGFHAVPTGWAGGTIYNPDNGNTYHARITVVDADHLRLRGCVFVPLCAVQTWTRAPAERNAGAASN